MIVVLYVFFFFSSRRRHTRSDRDWSSDVCSSDLRRAGVLAPMMFQATIHLGLVLNHLGRSDEAIGPLEVAVTTSGRHPWTLAALAVCYSSLGRQARVEGIHYELLARAPREYRPATVRPLLGA